MGMLGRIRVAVAGFVVCFCAGMAPAAGDPVEFFGLHSDALGAPFVHYADGDFHGLLPDMYRRIATAADLTYRPLERPRRRVPYVLADRADVLCGVSRPAAALQTVDGLIWTDPVATVTDLVVTRRAYGNEYVTLADLRGAVSVVEGAKPLPVGQRAELTTLLLEPAPDPVTVIHKVAMNRTTYGVVDDLTLSAARRDGMDVQPIVAVGDRALRCAVRADSPHAVGLVATINSLASAGAFQDIVDAYRR